MIKKAKEIDAVTTFDKIVNMGPIRESNPGPLAPEARIIPLDQQADAYDSSFLSLNDKYRL